MIAGSINNQNFIAFLFDADHEALTKEYNYATPCQDELLNAVISLEKSNTFKARIRHGDVLIHNFASKPSRVVYYPRPEDHSTAWTSSMHQEKIDKRVLYTAIDELKNDFSNRKSTIDLDCMWEKLLTHNIYCLSIFPIDLNIAFFINEKLKNFPPYIGMANLDKESELHIKLFAELPDCGYIHEGIMNIPQSIWGEEFISFGSRDKKIIPIKALPYSEYVSLAPIFPKITNKQIAPDIKPSKLQLAMQNNHSEQIAEKLLSKYNSDKFSVEFTALTADQEHLKIHIKKLLNYLLDIEHEKGKDKARFFHEVLGIDASQWRYLAYQLINEANRAEILELEVTTYGIKYATIVEVIGLNGRKATVKVAWQVNNNTSQLVTAFPAKKSLDPLHKNTILPPLILQQENKEKYFQEIFEAANSEGINAAKECIPEPFVWLSEFSNDGGIETEGKCGNASVILSRESDFAEWILQNNYGIFNKDLNNIAIYSRSQTQSLDREKAYANSFAKVLWLNGIEKTHIEYNLT